MGEVGRTDQFQHCESADDVIMSIVKGSTLEMGRSVPCPAQGASNLLGYATTFLGSHCFLKEALLRKIGLHEEVYRNEHSPALGQP